MHRRTGVDGFEVVSLSPVLGDGHRCPIEVKRMIPIAILAAMFVAFACANTQLCRLLVHRPWRTPMTPFADTFRASNASRGWPIELGIWIYTLPEAAETPQRPIKFHLFSWNAGSWIVKDEWHEALIGFVIAFNVLVALFTLVGIHNLVRALLGKWRWSLRSMLITSAAIAVTIALLNKAAVNPLSVGGVYGGLAQRLTIRYASLITLNVGFFAAIVWWSSATGTRFFQRNSTLEHRGG